MATKKIILILFTAIFLISPFGLRFVNLRQSESDLVQIFYKVFVGSQMTVDCTDELDCNKIRINLAATDKSVFRDGAFLGGIGESYGGPVFDVFYDEKRIGLAIAGNKNDWYTNKFEFDFFEENGKVRFKFRPFGKKGLEEGYIWIEELNDSLVKQSYDIDGTHIHTWVEPQTVR